MPWTVLILSQRLGRILRPWQEPREIYVYNLIPSTMENEEIHLAINWKKRLDHRNKELSSFTEIPVMVDRGSQFELFELSRSLNDFGDTDLNLDQVLEFIEKTDNLQTTSFIDDLSHIDDDEIKELRSLPTGIKSIKESSVEKPSLYVLFQYKSSKRFYPVQFNKDAEVVKNSEQVDSIMNLIRSSRDEQPLLREDIKDTDLWIDRCKNNWAAKRNVTPEDLTVVCVMMLTF